MYSIKLYVRYSPKIVVSRVRARLAQVSNELHHGTTRERHTGVAYVVLTFTPQNAETNLIWK